MTGRTSRRSSGGRTQKRLICRHFVCADNSLGEHPVHIPRRRSPRPPRARCRRAEATSTLALGSRRLSQHEPDGLVPRHRSSFVEGSAGSRLPEPDTGCAEVALAPGLEEREGRGGYAELVPFRVDGSLEAKRFFVSSEAGGGEGETEDLDGLLHHVSNREHRFEGAQPVLLGEVVVPPVHGAVGEVVIRRAHAPDVFAVARRGMELPCQWFCALELPGCHEQLAHTGERAADERLMAEMTGELEVLL